LPAGERVQHNPIAVPIHNAMPGIAPNSPSAEALVSKGHRRRSSVATVAAEPNVREVVLGDLRIPAWYPSFYPEELVGRKTERLFVCPDCFKYSVNLDGFLEHRVWDLGRFLRIGSKG
jgi:hypothetical protein